MAVSGEYRFVAIAVMSFAFTHDCVYDAYKQCIHLKICS